MTLKKKKTEFVPNPNNHNLGSQRGTRMLETTVRRVGAGRSGVAAKDGTIIAGNHALQAMNDLDIPIREVRTDGSEWVVVVREDIESAEDPVAVELAHADNRISQVNYTPDIAKIVEASQKQPLDTLYSPAELKAMITKAVEKDREAKGKDLEERDKPTNYLDLKPRAKVGEVWQCGAQKIICGDARNIKVWEKLFQENKCNICFTSPPYAKQRVYDKESGFEPIEREHYSDWYKPIQEHLQEFLTPDGNYFLNIKADIENHCRTLYDKQLLLDHSYSWGWMFRDDFCWVHNGTPGRIWYNFKNQWEPVYHFTLVERMKYRPEAVGHQSQNIPTGGGPAVAATQGSGMGIGVTEVTEGIAYPGNVIKAGLNRDAWGFPAAFPIALPTFFIRGYSDPSDVIFDPFCGSGTTLVAAQIEQRRGLGIDLSPKAIEVALLRLEQLTETKAHRV